MNEPGHFRLAEPVDALALLSIIEETDFKGKIGLLYTRRPDPYLSFQREGQNVLLYVCEINSTPVGFGACSVSTVFLDGEKKSVGYLFSFRVKKEFLTALRFFPEGYRFHFNACRALNVESYLTTILSENNPARIMLEKKRKAMPLYDYIGEITTYSLVTGQKSRLPKDRKFKRAQDADACALLLFLEQQGKKYQYFPILTEEDLTSGTCSPWLKDFYMLQDSTGNILACGAVWDQREYKQYIASGYAGLYRFLRPLSIFLFPLLGFPALPPKGQTLNFFALSFFICKDEQEEYFLQFLNCIRSEFTQFSFFSFGLHESHSRTSTMKKIRSLKYKSRLYRVFESGAEVQPFKGVPFVEIGRL